MQDPSHALFNDKTIQRLCSNISITKKQKDSTYQWIQWIDRGVLEDEVENYPQFAFYILQNILGYKIKKEWKLNKGKIEFSFRNFVGEKGVGIEVKGTSCKNLFAPQRREKPEHGTPIKQLWSYIGGNDFDYGICTNYQHFVLIDRSKGSSKYHFFDFLEIKNNKDKLKEFIAIFSKENIIDNGFIPKLYEESILEEREFTKQFYKLYHETRLMLIKEFLEKQPYKEDAIHFAQLFLNRIIFILFAEDTDRIPKRLFEDSIIQSLNPSLISEYSHYVSDTIKLLFERLDRGSNKPIELFGFNGGLFKELIPHHFHFKDLRNQDFFIDVLQYSNLKIKLNEIIQRYINKFDNNLNPIIKNLLLMSSFNFKSELNVNILGHIFEQSIIDLEDLKKSKISKRKLGGIYYTPDYITDYICKNTIIPQLSEKGVNDISDLLDEYKNNIEDLEKKFKEIKILDPACGSGAFLLKAVDVLLEIHKQIQFFKEAMGQYSVFKKSKKSKSMTEQLTLTKWQEEEEARKIIENNIFGVDINQESVDITKLSLFLKIARINKKLIDLSYNIRQGNSIVSNNSLIGDLAFDWHQQFKEIFEQEGFDIIIGNPPYFVLNPKVLEGYNLVKGNYNTYVAFIEKSFKLTKPNGKISLIIPTTWLSGNNFKDLRKELLLKHSIREIIQLPYDIFEAYIDTMIIGIDKESRRPNKVRIYKYDIRDKAYEKAINSYQLVDSSTWERNINFNIIVDTSLDIIYQKYRKVESDRLGSISKINRGTLPPKEDNRFSVAKNDKMIHWFKGQIYRYTIEEGEEKEVFVNPDRLLENKPMELFISQKIMARQLVSRQFRLQFVFFDKICAFKKNLYAIYKISDNYNPHYLLAILNSKIFSFVHVKANVSVQRDDFPSFSLNDFRNFLIPKLSKTEQKPLAEQAIILMQLNKDFNDTLTKAKNRIKINFEIDNLGNKLNKFYCITFKDFLKQINEKSKLKLTLKDQDEWEDYFNNYKKELLNLEQQIKNIDHKIDKMVYKIYQISELEIATIDEYIKQ